MDKISEEAFIEWAKMIKRNERLLLWGDDLDYILSLDVIERAIIDFEQGKEDKRDGKKDGI